MHFSGYDMFVFILLGFGTADVLASPAPWYLIGGPFIGPYFIY